MRVELVGKIEGDPNHLRFPVAVGGRPVWVDTFWEADDLELTGLRRAFFTETVDGRTLGFDEELAIKRWLITAHLLGKPR